MSWLVSLLAALLILSLFPKRSFTQEWVVSSYPLYKIWKELFPEEPIYLIQPPKGEFHFAEPRPKEWEKIKKAEFVIIVGSEPWAQRVYKITSPEKIFSLSRVGEKTQDPHLWFDLNRVERLLKEFLESSSLKKRPLYPTYLKRTEIFLGKLKHLRENFQELQKCPMKEFYSLGHSVFYYLFKDTVIKEIPLIKGHHHGEISSKKLRELLTLAKEKKIAKIVLTEREFIKHKSFFEREGLEVLEAWSGDYEAPGTFLELIENNLRVFKKLLQCP